VTGGERIVEANGVPLCVATHGDPADPAILLIHGACASLLWWDTELCDRLAAGRRFVIRYDRRDTGRSVSYPAGRPGYALADLADDAIGILDACRIDRAHLVGRSMGGGVALIAAADRPDRVRSLTFLGSTTGEADLPPMPAQFLVATGEPPDPGDRPGVVRYVVDLMRAYAGSSPYFPEQLVQALAERDVPGRPTWPPP
jgi:pimeloyl-ACP methyl ester carboxylesterase